MIPAINMLALGDSLTEGFGVGPRDNYPAGLEARLHKKGFNCRVINAGVSGDTCRNLMARMDRVLDPGPDLVILEIGLNDILMGAMPERIRQNDHHHGKADRRPGHPLDPGGYGVACHGRCRDRNGLCRDLPGGGPGP